MRSQLSELPRVVDRAPGLIVITPERSVKGEIASLKELYKEGLFRLHIRKPAMSTVQLLAYAKSVAEVVDPAIITVHYSKEVATELSLGGLHERYENHREGDQFTKSISCHSTEEVERAKDIDYMFLSPIFDSISKSGYSAAFNLEELTLPQDRRVVALGGINIENIEQTYRKGFYSAALLGALWSREGDSRIEIFSQINRRWREMATKKANHE